MKNSRDGLYWRKKRKRTSFRLCSQAVCDDQTGRNGDVSPSPFYSSQFATTDQLPLTLLPSVLALLPPSASFLLLLWQSRLVSISHPLVLNILFVAKPDLNP